MKLNLKDKKVDLSYKNGDLPFLSNEEFKFLLEDIIVNYLDNNIKRLNKSILFIPIRTEIFNRTSFLNHFQDKDCNKTLAHRIFCIHNNYFLFDDYPKCDNCKIIQKSFLSSSAGLRNFCSNVCAQKSEITLNKIKNTMIERHGVEHISHSIKVREKTKKTNLEKYGVENTFQKQEFKEKSRQTCLEKYGTEYASQSHNIKEKIKQTNLERYGSVNVFNTKKYQDIAKQRVLELYGISNVFTNDDIKEKIKETCKIKYGTEYASQSKIVKDKMKETCKSKYGTEYASQNIDNINKVKETCKIKYGGPSPISDPNVLEKIRRSRYKNTYNNFLNANRLKGNVKPLFSLEEYNGIENNYKWQCTKCDNIFHDHLQDGKIPRCHKCFPILIGTSKAEQEIFNFVKSNLSDDIEVINSDRKTIYPLELDIYIPSKHLAIEFNGLYWHSEIGGEKDAKYHLNKTNLCKEKGIHLIHIFEDEWFNKQDIIKSIILNKLGLSSNKIYARKCVIKPVINKDAELFLFDNHLQGHSNGKHYGLYYKDELVSIFSYGKSRYNKQYDFELLRFCTKLNTNVIGGFSKLLNHFKINHPNKSLITYSDLRYGNGSTYLNNGFEFIKRTNPAQYYIKGPEYTDRENRLKYQKHKLSTLFEDHDPNLTAWQNMQLNGYDRIWDCGNNSFKLII